mmetsp:Transcript_121256/g.304884  ORF Transcript_121256/g.304884 Transcript_121256/m.304884 type:complete len:159 (+) Transcript_121256:148-624(+)
MLVWRNELHLGLRTRMPDVVVGLPFARSTTRARTAAAAAAAQAAAAKRRRPPTAEGGGGAEAAGAAGGWDLQVGESVSGWPMSPPETGTAFKKASPALCPPVAATTEGDSSAAAAAAAPASNSVPGRPAGAAMRSAAPGAERGITANHPWVWAAQGGT